MNADVNAIDLRSDTVTRPTPAMMQAIMNAAVGDDVFGEDPTVLELERTAANLLGKEAAVYVPSGTMGNQIGLRVHTRPGDEVILDADAHIRHYEGAAAAGLSGLQLYPIHGERGIMRAAQVAEAIRGSHDWDPRTRLVCVENTHNRAGGTVYSLESIRAIENIARENNLAMHLDGARIWNASTASGTSEAEYAACFDTVSVCLSKGLGAPVGSILAGSEAHIVRARRERKALGGGMRQVGIIAAAALYALNHHRGDLVHDHERARMLAEGLSAFRNVAVDPDGVETNIVMFDITDGRSAIEVLSELDTVGVRMVPFGPVRIRATTHRDLNPGDIEDALERSAPVLDRL